MAENMCQIFVNFLLTILLIIILRVFYLIRNIRNKRILTSFFSQNRTCIYTMIIAGSGGHTAEILRLLGALGPHYKKRKYVIATTDKMSQDKIIAFEKSKSIFKEDDYDIMRIPRSREVKQSWITTVFSTLLASCYSLPIVFYERPDLILTNGPGTCIPICCAGFLLRVLGVKSVKIVYVESICRVKTLSLSGKILYYFADEVLVQWPPLKEKYPLTRYLGRLT